MNNGSFIKWNVRSHRTCPLYSCRTARASQVSCGSKKVFAAVAAHAFAREHIRRQRLHWDSTSKSLYGSYPEAEEAVGDASPEVADRAPCDVRQAPPAVPQWGYSKDPRPAQAAFVCQRCGQTDNADHNAAAVIATRGIKKVLSGDPMTKHLTKP